MSRTPSLAEMSPRRGYAYYEYVGGGSSKFYAISLEEEAEESWRVRFNFGRIGFPRAWASRIEGASWAKAAKAYQALVEEREGKGYEFRPWPAYLTLPDGSSVDEDSFAAHSEQGRTLFQAATRGTLPPEDGGMVGGISLPAGLLYEAEPEGGSRGDDPVFWASDAPVENIDRLWSQLAAAFPETGIWPVIIDATYGFDGLPDRFMDVPRGRHTEVLTILRRGWGDSLDLDDDDPDGADLEDELAPFGKVFPGLADPTPGDRPTSVDHIVAGSTGHLGLATVHRPADILDAVGWMGAANYDGDPLNMTTVLRSWEHRFDAYVVGMGSDTLVLAVGRPPRDLASATAIAAEHYAFCPDNIQQGVGSIREYAEGLVDAAAWPFWWD